MKVSTSSKKEPNSKVEKKYLVVRKENSYLKKLLREERKKTKAMRASRDNWKEKNKFKAKSIKGLKRKIDRLDKPMRHHYKMSIIKLCTLLRVICGCSYRSIVKVLQVLQFCELLEISRIPCGNTVENWVAKMGLYQVNNAVAKMETESSEVGLIIDESLKISNERALLILLTPSEKQTKQALCHTDVEVGYLGGKKSWTGETIQQEVIKLLEDSTLKIGYVLSDEDSKLLKATRLLGVPHLPDINHAIANCLRKTFKKNDAYQGFIKLLGGYASKSVNQSLTYLRPPKQRTKARFMNQKSIVYWALKLLERFEELNEEEQSFFIELKTHQSILATLEKCIVLSEQIVQPLKEEGLCQKTLKAFEVKIKEVEVEHGEDNMLKRFVGLLKKYAGQYKSFLSTREGCYNVSSDVIESLFGKHKRLVSDNSLVGVSLLDLELPVHCMNQKDISTNAKVMLEDVFMTDIWDWRTTHSIGNQALRRNKFFQKRA